MNTAMGIVADGALPVQVEALVAATGIVVNAPAAAAPGVVQTTCTS